MPTTPPLPALQEKVRAALQAAAMKAFGQELPDLVLAAPPEPRMGDFAIAACLPLAKPLRRPPRAIAEAVVAALEPVQGVARFEIAGPGYINVFLDRSAFAPAVLSWLEAEPAPPRDIFDAPKLDHSRAKVIVEHTNINPNKSAHVGHLRNAVLGDCLVRMLQATGTPVEVQNYIDDTGVQVADVVVAFTAMEGLDPEQALAHVTELVEHPQRPFDHACWDVYAAVARWYAEDKERESFRRDALHAMEHGEGALAELGEIIALAVVNRHIKLMDRIGVRYHVLPWEGDIIASQFWASAFEHLKERGAVHLETEGKNAGCWVMRLTENEEFKNLEDPDKVIVRSNGTVTYVGKDIAFQMWKLGVLGKDFRYRPFKEYGDGKVLWTSDAEGGSDEGHPDFGHAVRVYNVIDVRQSYLQAIVKNGLLLLGHEVAADASVHFSYEMVALTPRTAEALGFELSDEERKSAYIEMSGRRGLGVKADDLLDRLALESGRIIAKAAEERGGMSEADVARTAEQVAVGALRYYMAKVTRNRVIAFDIEEALQFQGETGPYLQYSTVRAANIFRKLEAEGLIDVKALPSRLGSLGKLPLLDDDATWSVLLAAARIPEAVHHAVETLEVTHLAKHAFVLAQSWNAFYRENSLLHAESEDVRMQRSLVARVFLLAQRQVLGILGIPEPERM